MENLLGQQETLRSPESVTRRLVIDAKRNFEGVADDEFLEKSAREAVYELWGDSIKVTAFVPVLAMRRLKEIVYSREDSSNGAASER
jgi:hypothetical protein